MQIGLVIEEVDLAGGSGHEEKNDALGLRGMMNPVRGRKACAGKKGCEGSGSETHSRIEKERAARLLVDGGGKEVSHDSVV